MNSNTDTQHQELLTGQNPSAFLQYIGATSWYDAFMCLFTYAFVSLLILSFVTVAGTFVASFFSGLKNVAG